MNTLFVSEAQQPPPDLSSIDSLADFRLARGVEHILALGPRPIIELLIEIGEQRLCRTFIEQRVQRYSEINPEHLAALGGDTFPRPPLYEVAP